jgi:hypothetical protein
VRLIDWLIYLFIVRLGHCSPVAPRLFVPRYNLREPCHFTKFPDAPQTYALEVLWLQREKAQIHMLEQSQGFTSTKDVGGGFILCFTLSTQWVVFQPHLEKCLLRVLCPARKCVTTLDCILLKDMSLTLVPRQGNEINS